MTETPSSQEMADTPRRQVLITTLTPSSSQETRQQVLTTTSTPSSSQETRRQVPTTMPLSSQETPYRQVSALNLSSQETPSRQVPATKSQLEIPKSSRRQGPANEGPFKLLVPSSISKGTRSQSQSPTRPGGDYDVSLNYRIEDEHQHGETSTAGMVRGAILEADNWDLQALSASHQRITERSSTRRQIGDERHYDERSSERSITPYRRQFDISRGDEF